MEILLYGADQNASLLLMAIGFSLVYGICRLPNFAHGAIFVFTGFVASDVWAKTGNELSQVLNGAPLVWDSQEVGLAEAASLDALWIAAGELEKEVSDIKITPDIQINYWPLVGGAALLLSAGLLLHTIFSKAFKGARA